MSTHIDLANISRRRDAVESRSISAENPDGSRGGGARADPKGSGGARDLGKGWKVRPCITLAAGATVTLMDIPGPGVIRHMWFTFDHRFYRSVVVRVYWDGQAHPSVEAPLGDLLCNAWNARQNVLALPINVNPQGGMNVYFPMPFRRHARITVQNLSPRNLVGFFYTVNYTLQAVGDDELAFHAHWRRSNPLPYKTDYVILDEARGQGQYVGVFMAWQQNSLGWWGEGEIKMYTDDDREYPTICGTGTEDYFGGAWAFGRESYSASYLGFQQVTGRSEDVGCRMTLYRFHVADPVFFKTRLRVTIQALGLRSEDRYLPLQDDISSVAYWYQALPGAPFPAFPDHDALEVT